MQMSYRPAAISRSWAGQNWGRQFNAFLVIAVTMKWAQHNGNRKHKQEKKNRIRSNFLLHVQIYDPLRSFNFSTTNVPWLWLLTQRIIPIDLIHQVNHFLRDPPGPLKEVGFPANVIHAGRNHWFLHFLVYLGPPHAFLPLALWIDRPGWFLLSNMLGFLSQMRTIWNTGISN